MPCKIFFHAAGKTEKQTGNGFFSRLTSPLSPLLGDHKGRPYKLDAYAVIYSVFV